LAPGQPGSEVNPGVDGSLVMDGMLDVERFREILKLKSLPEEDSVSYSTLGGLAMAALGRVPEVGDRFDWEGFQLEILSMDGLRVDKALVRHCDGSPLNPTA
ncbi:MAG TPA: transporter associated domain-containing protein, partial [Fibrobacteraceae bacterium]|nr:transporter associated domain-containing protein [Fibrobacteraceae bacterium]